MKKHTVKNIEAQLAFVEKGCRTRKLTLGDIQAWTEIAEERLAEMRLPKKYWVGTVLTVCEPYSVCASYNGFPSATQSTLERIGAKWVVTSIKRITARKGFSSIRLGKPAQERMALLMSQSITL